MGGFLSALVGLVAIGIFGNGLLFSGDNAPPQSPERHQCPSQYQTKEIDYAPGTMETAVIDIGFGSFGGELFALADSRSLISGQVAYLGDLVFEADSTGEQATISLREQNAGWLWFNLIIGTWANKTLPGNWASTRR
ncbi:MAG: hypothetical protein M5U34_02360 [Chloroflexi bacterium]|nr:hypothetical protein [Chloroflexota bacterium]